MSDYVSFLDHKYVKKFEEDYEDMKVVAYHFMKNKPSTSSFFDQQGMNPEHPIKMKEPTTQTATQSAKTTTQPQTTTEEEEEDYWWELVWGGMDWNAPSED